MRYIDIEGVVRTRMMTGGEIDDEDRECIGYKKGTGTARGWAFSSVYEIMA